jgi:hypothetical protein
MPTNRIWSVLLAVCALCALTGALLAPAATMARAEPLPPRPTTAPPSSRPTTVPPPTVTPQPTPTVAPQPTPSSEEPAPSSSIDQPEPGRITGTVVDLTTGAPAPNMVVVVSNTRLLSDVNGNYDRSGLAAGSYLVRLEPGTAGEAVQGELTVQVESGQTVIQHLAFRSQAPVLIATPTSEPEPVPPPVQLPATAGRTSSGWGFVLLGLALMGLGLALRRRA